MSSNKASMPQLRPFHFGTHLLGNNFYLQPCLMCCSISIARNQVGQKKKISLMGSISDRLQRFLPQLCGCSMVFILVSLLRPQGHVPVPVPSIKPTYLSNTTWTALPRSSYHLKKHKSTKGEVSSKCLHICQKWCRLAPWSNRAANDWVWRPLSP